METWVWGIRKDMVAPGQSRVLKGGGRRNGQKFLLHMIFECQEYKDKRRVDLYIETRVSRIRLRVVARLSKRCGHVTEMVSPVDSIQRENGQGSQESRKYAARDVSDVKV